MIHCVGSRQIPGIHEENEGGYLNEYCSRTCCSATLYAANLIRERYPQTRIFDFYRDIRTMAGGRRNSTPGPAKTGWSLAALRPGRSRKSSRIPIPPDTRCWSKQMIS